MDEMWVRKVHLFTPNAAFSLLKAVMSSMFSIYRRDSMVVARNHFRVSLDWLAGFSLKAFFHNSLRTVAAD